MSGGVTPFRPRPAHAGQNDDNAPLTMAPLMDLVELDGGCCLYCNLPGVEPENIALTIDGEYLHLRAEVRLTPFAGKIHVLEFSDAVYEGKICIPAIDVTRVEAFLANGLLRVFMPFRARSGSVRIPVAAG